MAIQSSGTDALLPASPTNAPGEGRHVILSLDGLRGVAAMAVLLLHMGGVLGRPFAGDAYLAVDVFFVLSGFVVARAYEQRLMSGLGWRRFMVIRLIRLYPLYALGLAFGGLYALAQALGAANHHALWRVPATLISSAAFLPVPPELSVDRYQIAPLVIPAWSLFFELVANLAYAVLVRRLSNTVLIATVAVSALALTLAGMAYGSLDIGPHWDDFAGGFPRVIFSFCVGVLLARGWRGFSSAQPIIFAAILVATGAFLVFSPAHIVWIDLPFVIFASPAIVWSIARLPVGPIGAQACGWAGSLSYSVYILHEPLLRWLDLAARKHAAALVNPPGLALVIILLTILGISWAADVHYDAPVRAALNRR